MQYRVGQKLDYQVVRLWDGRLCSHNLGIKHMLNPKESRYAKPFVQISRGVVNCGCHLWMVPEEGDEVQLLDHLLQAVAHEPHHQ